MSTTVVAIALTFAGVIAYATIVLYGARIDGKRQALRNKGLHPVTTRDGHVEAREQEHGRSSNEHKDNQS